MNEIINALRRKEALLKKAGQFELVDHQLWFRGYSIYLTAWCKKYLAMKIFDPEYDRRTVLNIKRIYKELLYDWEIHHLPSRDRNILVPQPPKLFQLEDAAKYLEARGLLTLAEPQKTLFANSEILKLLRGHYGR